MLVSDAHTHAYKFHKQRKQTIGTHKQNGTQIETINDGFCVGGDINRFIVFVTLAIYFSEIGSFCLKERIHTLDHKP